MPETFPTTPRARKAVGLGAVAIGLAGIVLATRTTITSTRWIGRTFPGFMLLDNRVVASVGLAQWPGTRISGLYQSLVVAVDGRPVGSTRDVYAAVASRPPGTPIRYRIERDGLERDVVVESARFTTRDWFLLFGVFLLNGTVILAAGLVPWMLSPTAALPRALLAWGMACAVFLLTAMDLYGPSTFFRLHVVGEAALPAALLQLAFLFPQPYRRARWRFVGYGGAFVIVTLYQAFLYRPAVYSKILEANMAYLGATGVLFGIRLVSEYWRGRSHLARQRVRLITLGTLVGFGVPGIILFVAALVTGGVAMNLAALTPFLFSLSLAYAVVKHDLFEIDAMVKRGAYYLLFTGAVGATYVAAVFVFNAVLKAGAPVIDARAFPVFITLAVVLLFDPLRARLQSFVDRVFFQTGYDSAKLLASAGSELASALKHDRIDSIVRQCVEVAIPNVGTRLFLATGPDEVLRDARSGECVPAAVHGRLTQHPVITAFDPSEIYPDAAAHDAVRAAMATLDAEVAVPLQLRGKLVGVLTAGAKRSGLFYTAGDAEFLQALAHQTAIALENARTYEAVVELNARLEERVRERTAQLEHANQELVHAYAELKSAETQLVHSEKMASLGRLVAGVAHEINNPVSFISASVVPLRRRLVQAAALAPAPARRALAEAEDIAGIMARGAERTAAIVQDLRTFSRLGESSRKEVDLHEGLEVTLRLLEPRWRGRIAIHRDYGALPPVECDPGQLNQAFMNILANACDAVRADGNVWITTRADGGDVTVTIRDDGVGIPPDVIGRIFDPFFTTKDVGTGTGLGLAISHTVVAAHGGRIDVDSAPGRGTTFRIVLPIGAPHLATASGER